MTTLPLDWLKSHPYVQAWREMDTNSYFPAVENLNTTLNVNVDHPITISRVDHIVSQYLEQLVRHVRQVCSKERCPRDKRKLAGKFQLNNTEINYVLNKLNKNE